ncbi:MAG TPA: DUF1801 domain-containing protein [Gemmatimonadales bacterium]|nr:DUF1801 domain-containing protein [Gemmatimonadales bacterium]
MAEPRTRPTGASVEAFLAAVPDARRRADALVVAKLIERVTGERPAMWGPSIVGYGTWRLRYADGRSADWPVAGFSPRKAELVLYLMPEFGRYAPLLARLGRHRTGKSCLYLKRLADVDLEVLEELVASSVARVRAEYP